MKSNYWSCSKFADWIRGTPIIQSGTSKEWSEWRKHAKRKKFRYWLAEEALDCIQDFVNWPIHRLNHIRYYIRNRWISKTHTLTSSLERGQWHEFETRLLYSSFDSLVDFVEIEQAYIHIICRDKARKKYNTPWYWSFFRISQWRCPEAGLDYLNWAASLRHDEDWIKKDDPDYGKPTRQALAAQETIILYNWWKNERPMRADPIEASGWSNYCEEKRKKMQENGMDSDLLFIDDENKSEEDEKRAHEIRENYHKMACEQDEEDTEMLIRLIKLRRYIWT